MPRAFWTPVAESDLDDILFYISFVDRKPATGERIFFEIRDRVYPSTPQRGSLGSGIPPLQSNGFT